MHVAITNYVTVDFGLLTRGAAWKWKIKGPANFRSVQREIVPDLRHSRDYVLCCGLHFAAISRYWRTVLCALLAFAVSRNEKCIFARPNLTDRKGSHVLNDMIFWQNFLSLYLQRCCRSSACISFCRELMPPSSYCISPTRHRSRGEIKGINLTTLSCRFQWLTRFSFTSTVSVSFFAACSYSSVAGCSFSVYVRTILR